MPRLPRAIATLSTVALAAAIGSVAASAQQPKTIRVAMHGDVRTLDPVWTTQVIATIHGNMIYDQLFNLDAKLEPQPQMVETWTVSDDRKTYVFTLREGLKFHDGSPVRSIDAIASFRRWAARRNAGKLLLDFTDSINALDDRRIEWKLNQPYGLVLDTLAQTGTGFVMREKEAKTDPFQQVQEVVGSGPFLFKRDEWVPGSKTVYVKNPNYIPRKEPASGHAGGKTVKVDRVEFLWMADPQTAQSALINGEIDYLENPQIDFLPMLESTPGVKLINHAAHGTMGQIVLNHLHPPFNNVKARQAMLSLINIPDYLNTVVADKKLQKLCYSYFGCGTPMETDAGAEPQKAAPDYKRAEQLFKEAGYKGEPITILHATDHQTINPANQVMIQQMRKAGFLKLDAQAMDWGAVVARRAKKDPPAQGGWNIFLTTAPVLGLSNPVTHSWIGMSCEKANVGWPCNAEFEEVRKSWGLARTIEDRKKIAVDLSKRLYAEVPYVSFGQWVNPVAYREDRISGVLAVPSVPPMWNIEKK
ncbi:peptide/nickel transport system substrate-binding protein [Stella humosa]|uniref:Peptide/nickel transport system substrate-binding protein n=1 Tax=Stella humosa TaxID=94 RepID=A0A3N1M333_9PROT|nr:ABC transporter substrate-binding protein [Stella humosa]ROQ00132.1 peptide/nickel transport system substrate-binding protein [Stella humosa]BBK30634.1 ABC transporter substrate-binding protein [Stella humosa]